MKLSVRHDLHEEAREVNARRTGLLNGARQAVRSTSFALERRIKLEMPVDTGRARASWGHWSGGVRGGGGDPGEAVWQEKDDGLSVTQGSNVEYIEGLNAGNSKQAPAGFLDVAERWAMEQLDNAIDAIMDRW